jgi:predicted MFS family arabinose efflux permease
MVADSVPLSHLTNAIGLNSVVFNMSRSTGPALAGVLIAMFGSAGSYAVQATFYLLATLFTVPLSPEQHSSASPHGHTASETSFGQSIIQGWKFSWSTETVRTALLIAASGSFFIIPFTTLLPVFARDLLEVGATGQGFFLTSMGVGSLCSAIFIASLSDQAHRGMLMMGGVAMYGVSVMAFSASPWFELSVVFMLCTGLFHVSSHTLVQTVIQTYSPSDYRGRTMAILQQVHFLLTLGSVLLGALAALLGARWALALMSATGTLSMIAIYVAIPHARRIR